MQVWKEDFAKHTGLWGDLLLLSIVGRAAVAHSLCLTVLWGKLQRPPSVVCQVVCWQTPPMRSTEYRAPKGQACPPNQMYNWVSFTWKLCYTFKTSITTYVKCLSSLIGLYSIGLISFSSPAIFDGLLITPLCSRVDEQRKEARRISSNWQSFHA